MWWQDALAPILVAVVAGLFAWANARPGRESGLIDQMQEEIARLDGRITTMQEQIAQMQRHERIRDDYIIRLRRHIADELGPPPPVWPEGLAGE